MARLSHDDIGPNAVGKALTHIPEIVAVMATLAVVGLGLCRVLGVRQSQAMRIAFVAGVSFAVATTIKDELKLGFGRTWPETWVATTLRSSATACTASFRSTAAPDGRRSRPGT